MSFHCNLPIHVKERVYKLIIVPSSKWFQSISTPVASACSHTCKQLLVPEESRAIGKVDTRRHCALSCIRRLPGGARLQQPRSTPDPRVSIFAGDNSRYNCTTPTSALTGRLALGNKVQSGEGRSHPAHPFPYLLATPPSGVSWSGKWLVTQLSRTHRSCRFRIFSICPGKDRAPTAGMPTPAGFASAATTGSASRSSANLRPSAVRATTSCRSTAVSLTRTITFPSTQTSIGYAATSRPSSRIISACPSCGMCASTSPS